MYAHGGGEIRKERGIQGAKYKADILTASIHHQPATAKKVCMEGLS